MMLDALYENFALHFSLLIFALLFIKIAKLHLNKYVFVYAIFGSVDIIIHHMLYPMVFTIDIIISLIIGILFMLLLAGIFGNKLNHSNYSSILAYVGLSPWYLGIRFAFFYLLGTLITLFVWTSIQQFLAFKKLGYQRMGLSEAKAKLDKDEYAIIVAKTNLLFVYPFIIVSCLSVLFYSLA